MANPITNSKLPIIEPVKVAFTTCTKPLFKAIKAKINSVALPKVALSNPPKLGPTTTAIFSVASPINAANGTIARAALRKMTTSPQCKNDQRWIWE